MAKRAVKLHPVVSSLLDDQSTRAARGNLPDYVLTQDQFDRLKALVKVRFVLESVCASVCGVMFDSHRFSSQWRY
jgi:hypothetical protein